MKTLADFVQNAFLGFAVGDALGVPVEFETREWLQENPVKGMLGGMRHNQHPGTWSDDSSMLFCTAESLCGGYTWKISPFTIRNGKTDVSGLRAEGFLISAFRPAKRLSGSIVHLKWDCGSGPSPNRASMKRKTGTVR